MEIVGAEVDDAFVEPNGFETGTFSSLATVEDGGVGKENPTVLLLGCVAALPNVNAPPPAFGAPKLNPALDPAPALFLTISSLLSPAPNANADAVGLDPAPNAVVRGGEAALSVPKEKVGTGAAIGMAMEGVKAGGSVFVVEREEGIVDGGALNENVDGAVGVEGAGDMVGDAPNAGIDRAGVGFGSAMIPA